MGVGSSFLQSLVEGDATEPAAGHPVPPYLSKFGIHALHNHAHTDPLLQPRSLFDFPPERTQAFAHAVFRSVLLPLSKPYLTVEAHLWFFLLRGDFLEQLILISPLQHWPSGLAWCPVIPSLGCTCIVLRCWPQEP